MPGMATRVPVPAFSDTTGHRSTKDPLLSLVEVISGYPETVHADKDPLRSRPEDLYGHRWYLVRSDQIGDLDAERGASPDAVPKYAHSLLENQSGVPRWARSGMMLQYFITTSNGTFSVCRIGTDPRNDTEVGGPVPLDEDGLRSTDHPIPGTGNQSYSDIFYGGDFMELLDLETPLFPHMYLE